MSDGSSQDLLERNLLHRHLRKACSLAERKGRGRRLGRKVLWHGGCLLLSELRGERLDRLSCAGGGEHTNC